MLITILERDNLFTSNHDYKSGPRRKQIKKYVFPRVICMIIAVFIKILLSLIFSACERRLSKEGRIPKSRFKKFNAGETRHAHRGVHPRRTVQQAGTKDHGPGYRLEVGRKDAPAGKVRQICQTQRGAC